MRLVVPGWIGIASVKWLGRIEVSTTRLWSPWNTKWYPRSFSEQVVKSAFELPWEATLAAGAAGAPGPLVVGDRAGQAGRREHRRRRDLAAGAAAGAEPPLRVGALLTAVDALGQRGPVELISRATGADGLRQPDRVPFNADGYMFYAAARHPVTVSG